MDFEYTDKQIATAIAVALSRPAKTIAYLGEGMDSIAYLANGDTVFRFPKDAETADASLAERRILPAIAQAVDVAVPEPAYFGRIQPSNFPFFGYPLLHGTFLSEIDQSKFSSSENETLAQTLARFLRQLHAVPATVAQDAGVARVNLEERYQADWEAVNRLLFPLISAELRSFLTKAYQTYFDLAASQTIVPTLLHGDIAADHILVNPESKAVIGIIDFGDCQLADPIYDLHWFGGSSLLPWETRLLQALPAYVNKKSDAKRRLFYIFNFVQDFVYGIECEQPDATRYGWDNLKRLSAEVS